VAAPRLSPELAAQLERVPTSADREFRYAPCRVQLKSGETLPRVYLADEASYLQLWGNDPGRSMIDIADVVAIEESRDRLPARLANDLYEAGEAGMGYLIFTVVLRDGRSIPFLVGNAVDFLDWPSDASPSDAVAVEPHVGREFFAPGDGSGRGSADYLWCLYSS
jgi:hypothetical protein